MSCRGPAAGQGEEDQGSEGSQATPSELRQWTVPVADQKPAGNWLKRVTLQEVSTGSWGEEYAD